MGAGRPGILEDFGAREMGVLDKIREVAEQRAGSDRQARNREWWDAAPMTYREWGKSGLESLTRENFEKINKDYLHYNPFIETWFDLTRSSGVMKTKRVLEIGCGAGSAAGLFAQFSASMTAIDITDQAIKMTRANARFNDLDINVKRMDAENMEFDDNSFDFVYSWGVIHHSANTENAIKEISRVLAPQGRGLVMVYNRSSIRYYIKGLYWLLFKLKFISGESIGSVQKYFTDGYYHKHYTESEFVRLLATYRLETTAITKTHMRKKYNSLLPGPVDSLLKKYWGWLLVAEFEKPNGIV